MSRSKKPSPNPSREFRLADVLSDRAPLNVSVSCNEVALLISLKGYGDACSKDGCGCPMLIEYQDGVPVVYIWADINKHDYTHKITLEGAAEVKRKEEK